MRRGVIFSGILHLGLFLLIIFGLPIFNEPKEIIDQPVVLEMVPITEKTNPRPSPTPREEPRPTPKPPEPQQETKPAPAPPPPPPPPPQPQVAERAPEPAPKPPEPKPEPKPEAKPEPVPAPKPEVKKEPPPKEEPKPAPPQRITKATPPKKPKPPAPPKDDFIASILKDVAPQKQQPAQPADTPPKPQAQPSPPPAPPSLDQQVSKSEIDAVRDQIAQCWNPPAGARDAGDLVVTIRADVGPDGRVTRAVITSTSRMNDPFYRTAAESALRAVLNPRCQPLKLPPQKYNVWKTLELNFNPKDMIG